MTRFLETTGGYWVAVDQIVRVKATENGWAHEAELRNGDVVKTLGIFKMGDAHSPFAEFMPSPRPMQLLTAWLVEGEDGEPTGEMMVDREPILAWDLGDGTYPRPVVASDREELADPFRDKGLLEVCAVLDERTGRCTGMLGLDASEEEFVAKAKEALLRKWAKDAAPKAQAG